MNDESGRRPPTFHVTLGELFDGSQDLRLEMQPIVDAWTPSRHVGVVVVARDGGSPPLNGTLRVDIAIDCKPIEINVSTTVIGLGESVRIENNRTRKLVGRLKRYAR